MNKKFSKQQVATVVRDASAIVAHSWCKGSLAEEKDGTSCSVTSRKADRFCAIGAIERASVDPQTGKVRKALARAAMIAVNDVLRSPYRRHIDGLSPSQAGELTASSVVSYNDCSHRRRKHVVAKFDLAVQKLESTETV